jgi:hypothetical protein
MTSTIPQEFNQQDATASAAHLVQELLDRVVLTSQAREANNATGEAPLAGAVRKLIDEVRAEYRLMADREIARALEAALGVDVSITGQPSEAAQSSVEANDAFDALEALIQGSEPGAHAGHDHARSSTELESIASPLAVVLSEEETLYEGTVRVYANADGHMQRVVRFVDDLGQRPQFRILRMTGNPQREGAEIDLGLREPTAFLELLRSMGHSAEALDDSSGGVPQITVRLHGLVAV